MTFTNVLCISNSKDSSERYYSLQGFDDGFIISYTHSVNKGRVHDYYTCDKKTGNLCLNSTFFVSYGAGIPEPEETPGAVFQVLDNGYLINNINRVVPELSMAVGLIANHGYAINYPGYDKPGIIYDEILFTDLFAPQTSIILQTKRVTLIEYLLHKI